MSSDELLDVDWGKMFSRHPFCVFTSNVRASGLASRLVSNGIRLVCWAKDVRDRKEVCQQWIEVTAISRGEKPAPPWIVIVDSSVPLTEVNELRKLAVVLLYDNTEEIVNMYFTSNRITVQVMEQLSSMVNHLIKQEREFAALLSPV